MVNGGGGGGFWGALPEDVAAACWAAFEETLDPARPEKVPHRWPTRARACRPRMRLAQGIALEGPGMRPFHSTFVLSGSPIS